MGFFGAYLFTDGAWTEIDSGDAGLSTPPSAWLFVSIHDSDIATIRYSPSGVGTGEAFLGFTPRTYFEDPSASTPTDTAIESAGLAAWTQVAGTGATPDPAVIERFLATDEEAQTDTEDDEDHTDDDIFVELKTAKLVRTLGLPKLEALE